MRPPVALLITLLALGGVLGDENGDAKHAAINTVVQALKPSGVRIAVPDQSGVSVVVINANINLPIDTKDRGQISKSITESKNGYWVLEDKSVALNPGDVVFFWIYMAIHNNDQRAKGRNVIKALVDPSCDPSPTTFNGAPACKGQLIFEENFDSFNNEIWKHTIQFSGDPDTEFCIYDNKPENSYVKDGSLHIVATVLDSDTILKPTKLEGCTWHRREPKYCEWTPIGWDILPPTRSAWVNTKNAFAFKYGRIEARVRAAEGDWLYSRFFLESKDLAYGFYPFDSGQLSLMRVRGNKEYIEPSGASVGGRHNNANLGIATCRRVIHSGAPNELPGEERFTDTMHIHSATWTPEFIRFDLDGKEVKTIHPPKGGFLNYDFFKHDCDSPWKKGDIMAPFDKEFHINFGLEVGGRQLFRDNGSSNGHLKPWRDDEPKIQLKFWKARDTWAPTWKSSLEVDYVKVWAL